MNDLACQRWVAFVPGLNAYGTKIRVAYFSWTRVSRCDRVKQLLWIVLTSTPYPVEVGWNVLCNAGPCASSWDHQSLIWGLLLVCVTPPEWCWSRCMTATTCWLEGKHSCLFLPGIWWLQWHCSWTGEPAAFCTVPPSTNSCHIDHLQVAYRVMLLNNVSHESGVIGFELAYYNLLPHRQ